MRLLEADPDLGGDLSPERFAEIAGKVILPSVRLGGGRFSPETLGTTHGVEGRVAGFLLIDGSVTVNLSISTHTCTRLLTPGELILFDGWEDDSVASQSDWAILEDSTLILFDDRLSVIGRRWPDLMTAILKRAAQQVRHSLVQQAIGQLPRVEDRLLALIWSIADRRGVVRPDGVFVQLPVTHEILAQMIGARRPTVSLGLRSLAEQELLRSESSGWLVSPASKRIFSPAAGRSG